MCVCIATGSLIPVLDTCDDSLLVRFYSLAEMRFETSEV